MIRTKCCQPYSSASLLLQLDDAPNRCFPLAGMSSPVYLHTCSTQHTMKLLEGPKFLAPLFPPSLLALTSAHRRTLCAPRPVCNPCIEVSRACLLSSTGANVPNPCRVPATLRNGRNGGSSRTRQAISQQPCLLGSTHDWRTTAFFMCN